MLKLAIITGAPGAGKSLAVKKLRELAHDFLVFDMDDLLGVASELAQTDVTHDASRWPAYRKVWLELLVAVAKNGKLPVLFGPIDKQDLAGLRTGLELHYLLLDCPDALRRERLNQRGWTEAQILEALEDAGALRASIFTKVDSSLNNPDETARALAAWLQNLSE